MTTWQVVLTDPARDDIRAILRHTAEAFGEAQRGIYRAKIRAAVARLGEGPTVPGSAALRLGAPGLWRLKLQRPARHFLIYRTAGSRILVLRLLHDAMDIAQHLPPDPPAAPDPA